MSDKVERLARLLLLLLRGKDRAAWGIACSPSFWGSGYKCVSQDPRGNLVDCGWFEVILNEDPAPRRMVGVEGKAGKGHEILSEGFMLGWTLKGRS